MLSGLVLLLGLALLLASGLLLGLALLLASGLLLGLALLLASEPLWGSGATEVVIVFHIGIRTI